jgi:septin family protein
VLVIGSKNCGKSSFIEFLRTSLAQPVKNRGTPSPTRSQSYYNTSFPCEYLETDIDGERVGLTLYDSQGLEKSIVDLQLQEMTSFIESKFEETFVQEQKVLRNAAAKDTHIHCVLLLLDPGRLHSTCNASYVRSSDEMSEGKKLLDATVDIEVLRTLHGLTTIVPIISKADTVTVAQMATLKRDLWQELSKLDFKPLSVLDFDSEETSASDSEDDWAQTEHQNDTDSLNTNDTFTRHTPKSTSIGIAVASLHSPTPSASPSSNKHEITDNDIPDIPMSIISPDVYEPDLVGRRFAWGFADPENSLHCDYPRLKESVFGDWRDDLREASKVRCYEKWRTSRLKRRISPATPHARSVSGGVQSVKKVNGGGVSRGMMANDIGVATSGLDDDQEVLDGIRKL